MKKLFTLGIALLAFAFQSCEKAELEPTDIDLAKIENVKSLSGDEQKVAYRLLSNDNKANYGQVEWMKC